MADNKNETEGMLKEFQQLKGSVSEMLNTWKGKMPVSPPKRVKIKGVLATAGLQIDGSINIQFDDKKEGKIFFDSLK